MTPAFAPSCPVPLATRAEVQLAHGGGGRLAHQLLEEIFRPAFRNAPLDACHDGAILDAGTGRIALTTDGHVVHPLFFPGGDIGSLAVHGTVNDLAMCGARPLGLAAGFILEEGLPMETLRRVVDSMRRAAEACGVSVVTGDTKVVGRGQCDGIYITTTGVGRIEQARTVAPASVEAGDAVLLSGDIGRHGIAIMAVREGLEFEGAIESDSAPLTAPVLALLDAGVEVHCLRDLTRGGLAGALIEIAQTSGLGIRLAEAAIPIGEEVRGACEMLGLDALHVANEGRFVAFVPAREIERALKILKSHPVSSDACLLGGVTRESPGLVTLESLLGPARILDLPSGEQLPRIC